LLLLAAVAGLYLRELGRSRAGAEVLAAGGVG
jgi:hypothetical protein